MGKKLLFVFLLGFFIQLIISHWTQTEDEPILNPRLGVALHYNPNYIWDLARDIPKDAYVPHDPKSARYPDIPETPSGEANEERFRDTVNFSDKKKTNCEKFVITLFGSSGIYGYKLRFQDSIGVQLEKRLAELGMPTNVYNFGVPGYTISQADVVSEKWVPELKPDLVLLNFGYNDSSLCVGKLTDSEFFKLIRFPLFDFDIIKRQLIKLNYQRCSSIRDSPFPVLLRPRVTLNEYFNYLLEFKSRTEAASNGEVWIWPLMHSTDYIKRSPIFLLRLERGMDPFYHEPQQAPFFAENKFKILTELEKIEDPNYFFEDGAHLSPAGVKKAIDVILPDIVKYLKTKKPKTCS